ncbi:histidine phosphatase family protein [Pseudoroseomonas cervicalis]|uniref:histidine phosphatase family protein n=1 Tax=Teichococcus cervicalis TaxID=204525 RepID=UPI002781E240|nr:histidine phosphatase family protein [Pseudoroseomonas cervicalis]MDQ1079399.1 phosphohistidine phosphatase SixA [Pseudoroseomonas cervicalis]
MRRRHLWLLPLAAAPVPRGGVAQPAPNGRAAPRGGPGEAPGGLLGAAEALRLLRRGGLNLYLRHGITDRAQADTGVLEQRAAQRNLSQAGEAQARALGVALRRLRVPVAEVLTSPVFRARDTAELAFGAAQLHPALVADDYTRRDPRQDAAEVSALLARPVVGGNRVLVGHIVPLGLVLGRGLSQAEFPEGAMALFQPQGAAWRFLGVVAAETLIDAQG